MVAADARAISDQVDRLDRDLLESRRAEKDFLLRNDEKYAQAPAELAKSVTAGLDALAGKAGAAALADLEQNVAAIRSGYATYQRHFGAVVAAKLKLGLNEECRARRDIAQIGSCDRDRAEGIRRAAPRRDHADDAAAREGLHAAPQRQIRRRHQEARRRVHRRARGESAIPPAARDDITQKLANYQRDFFEWMAAALVVVAEQKAMSDNYARIEPMIAAAQTVVEKMRGESEAADAGSRAEHQAADADRDRARLALRRAARLDDRPRRLPAAVGDDARDGQARRRRLRRRVARARPQGRDRRHGGRRRGLQAQGGREGAARGAGAGSRGERRGRRAQGGNVSAGRQLRGDGRRHRRNGFGRLVAAREPPASSLRRPRRRRSSVPSWSRRLPSRLPPTFSRSRLRPRR